MTVLVSHLAPRLRRSVRGLVAAALLAVAAAAGVPPAAAQPQVYTRFDFEGPTYGAIPHRLSDHFLIENGGLWHLFYSEVPGPAAAHSRIGHAVSSDLAHWTERPTVVEAGSPDWMASATWAPHVIAAPGGGWVMIFTGRNLAGSQVLAAAISYDLDHWELSPENPVWTPPASWARWGADFACSCRDGFVYPSAGAYHMVYTVATLQGQPAIGLAESLDLIHWSDLGPLMVDTRTPAAGELESPTLRYDNGRYELTYTQLYLRYQQAAAESGPWDPAQASILTSRGSASEFVDSGATSLMTRLLYDPCAAPTSYIWIDSVTATPDGYTVPPPPGLPASWRRSGDAFASAPTFGDPPALRGETPAGPGGLRWLSSAEDPQLPTCPSPAVATRTGTVDSPRFVLAGDALYFRIMGATSPDSTYLSLVDDCTGREIVRQSGPGTNAFASYGWSNSGRRGWPVRLRLVDALTRPGGVVGIDDVRDSAAAPGSVPAAPFVHVTQPAGGENLSPGQNYQVRWDGANSALVDSFVVYLSYDDFVTAPERLQDRGGSRGFWNWTVPAGTHEGARIRVVAYGKNGAHECDSSPPFDIGATVDVAGPPAVAGLWLAARGNPGPAPVLEWQAPAGRRATLALYDVRGRRVRSLFDGTADGPAHMTWDGRDDGGRILPAGVYFALLAAAGERRGLTLVRLTD